ncbi:LysR family transcriptional regulator [Lutispora thermophila]|uniref:DNA-binding transcriptional regulator, LysR family n=1 Tax=Lutispora thermophila DSM 19022 TaxID=1122184 RepID=A0A1M6EHJ0_9FIRM|nr:LysR family transcriptional regulator [Lutispora thermophila]SHI84748.1 DNA-binding transcriptional regulator, LysR family [Lutispora thermophila DSM 19022]
MNTQYLEYAIEVEKAGSITQAADNLFMAQPNLSKAIKELEDHLGFMIFERTSKGVVPTQKGAEFLVYARNILEQIDKMMALSKHDDPDTQRFSISIPRVSYIAHGFTKFVAGLDPDKGIEINVQETNSMQTINNIVEGKFNLGIIRYDNAYESYFLDYLEDKGLAHNLIWEFEYLALMSKDHPLATVQEVLYDDLIQYVEIIHGDNTIPYLSSGDIKKQSEPQRIEKKIYLYERGNQFELLSNIPATFMWVSPVPDIFLNRYNLVQRKCKGANNKSKDLLIYPKGYKFTKLDKKFINKLYESKTEVSFKEYF